MDSAQPVNQEVTDRLRQARDQVEQVIDLIESGGSCREIVTRLSAASKELNAAGYRLISGSMRECLLSADPDLGPAELEKLFISLA